MIDQETLDIRKEAFTHALTIVTPILESYPPEAYRITTGPSLIFSVPAGNTVTPAEQVISSILNVADWLLDKE